MAYEIWEDGIGDFKDFDMYKIQWQLYKYLLKISVNIIFQSLHNIPIKPKKMI